MKLSTHLQSKKESLLSRKYILLLLCIGLFLPASIGAQSKVRELKVLEFSSQGYELGLEHGKRLKKEIANILADWKKNTSKQLAKDADVVLKDFFEYAHFKESIQKWTPDLYQEIKGIAEGSEQKLEDILVLNLLDEFWVYINNIRNHHCSALGVPAKKGQAAYLSQNMDLEKYTDGYQILMRLAPTENRPEQLILSHPGLIALNGLNEKGIGVCVNTLMALKASSQGLPVAFVIRGILNTQDKKAALEFVQNVKHASGQNYMIGIQGEIYDFEASSNQVIPFQSKNKNGSIYHTNHPLVNDDIKPWFKEYNPNLKSKEKPLQSNSFLRYKSLEERLATSAKVDSQIIQEILRSKDNPQHPVCRNYDKDSFAFTFASVIFTLTGSPAMEVVAGPPDEGEFQKFDFESK